MQDNGATACRKVAVVFPGLLSGVNLLNPSGMTAAGDPYVNSQEAGAVLPSFGRIRPGCAH